MLETIPSAAAELGNISLSAPGFLSIISFLILRFFIVPCACCVCAVCAVLVASAELSSSECRAIQGSCLKWRNQGIFDGECTSNSHRSCICTIRAFLWGLHLDNCIIGPCRASNIIHATHLSYVTAPLCILCLNNLFFQELSNDVHNTHVARVHVPKNVSRSWSMKAKKQDYLTKTYF